MKLYFSPGACSRAANIVLHEAGLKAELVRVNLKEHKLVESGADFYAINAKGYVPALVPAEGGLLTENIAILEYLGDKGGLLAQPGDMARYHTIEWLAFISTEVHKSFSPLFNPAMPEAARAIYVDKLKQRFALLDKHLANREFIEGAFGLADAYAFTVLSWAAPMKIDLSGFPALAAYLERIANRASVKAAIAAED
jgi:glutathione S-transferase